MGRIKMDQILVLSLSLTASNEGSTEVDLWVSYCPTEPRFNIPKNLGNLEKTRDRIMQVLEPYEN